MAEEIDFENGRNSNFEGLVTLTFDPAIRHTVVHHSSTSTYIPNFIQIEETFCGRTDVRTDGRTYGRTYVRTDIFPLYTIRSTFGSRPKNAKIKSWKMALINWSQNWINTKILQIETAFVSSCRCKAMKAFGLLVFWK